MIKFGQEIPRGFVLAIHAWENDGDSYSIQYFYGLTKDDIEMFKPVLELFKSTHGHDGFGNAEISENAEAIVFSWAELILTGQITREFAKKYLDFELPPSVTSIESEDMDTFAELYSHANLLKPIIKLLGYPEYYDSDFVRVFEQAQFTFVKEAFTIPEFKFEKL
jgi:hypothetical protein